MHAYIITGLGETQGAQAGVMFTEFAGNILCERIQETPGGVSQSFST